MSFYFTLVNWSFNLQFSVNCGAFIFYFNLMERHLLVYLCLSLSFPHQSFFCLLFSQVHILYLTSVAFIYSLIPPCLARSFSLSLPLTHTSVPLTHQPGSSAPIAITFHLLPFLPSRSPKWLCSAHGGCFGPVNYARLSLRGEVQAN